jgi:hypothetical protein
MAPSDALTFEVTSESGCTVHFEPEGAEHELAAEDVFRVELSGRPSHFEIGHSPGHLTLWTQGCEIRGWNKAGSELAL